MTRGILLIFLALLPAAQAQDGKDYIPKAGEFPPANAKAHYLSGELVEVDHVNRRGTLRFIGDGVEDNYHQAPGHAFAMLPYGTIRYHGAPAELRDIPIGTLLHGYFFLPPDGNTDIPLPEKGKEKYMSPYTHALTLEDDFSFYQRQGTSWKVTSIDLEKGRLKVTPSKAPVDGLKAEQEFTFDPSTRVWKGRAIGALADLAVGQEAQVNLTWAPDWRFGQYQCADIWLDAESLAVATEMQRQTHIRFQRHRWLAGWVDAVEHEPGGRGTVTVTLFGGHDPSLYDAVRAQNKKGGGAAIAAAEWTLRTWWQEHDNKSGPVLEVKDLPNPPRGSSGVQVKVQLYEVLEGFRPGRIIRLRPSGFPCVKLPPEERIKSMLDR